MLLIYSPDRVLLGELSTYQDLLWTERFGTPGAFEFKMPPTEFAAELLAVGNFVKMAVDSDAYSTMLIERISLIDHTDDADLYKVSGSSLERVLDRRVIPHTLSIDTSLTTAFHRIMRDTFIEPTDNKRRWNDLRYVAPSNFSHNIPRVHAQYTGDDVLSIFEEFSQMYGVGFRVQLVEDGFTFQVYNGRDLSGRIPNAPRVEFSANFENLDNTEFSYGIEKLRNYAYVAGEGEGTSRQTAETWSADTRGLERRELYIDARDIRSESQGLEGLTTSLEPSAYRQVLIAHGKNKLSEHTEDMVFSGQATPLGPFRYGVDFTVGDIVFLEDTYGHASRMRITEYAISKSNGEFSAYPTFLQIGR